MDQNSWEVCFLAETRNSFSTSGLEIVYSWDMLFLYHISYLKVKFHLPPSPQKALNLEGRLQVDDATEGCKRNCFEMTCFTISSLFNHFCLSIAFFIISCESITSQWVSSLHDISGIFQGWGHILLPVWKAHHFWVISQPTNSRLGSLSFLSCWRHQKKVSESFKTKCRISLPFIMFYCIAHIIIYNPYYQ